MFYRLLVQSTSTFSQTQTCFCPNVTHRMLWKHQLNGCQLAEGAHFNGIGAAWHVGCIVHNLYYIGWHVGCIVCNTSRHVLCRLYSHCLPPLGDFLHFHPPTFCAFTRLLLPWVARCQDVEQSKEGNETPNVAQRSTSSVLKCRASKRMMILQMLSWETGKNAMFAVFVLTRNYDGAAC